MWNDGPASSGALIWSDGDVTLFDPGTGTFLPFSQKSDILQNTALWNGSVKLFNQAENDSCKELPCCGGAELPGGGETRDSSS